MNILSVIPKIAHCYLRRLHERKYFRVITCAFLVAVFSSSQFADADNTIVRMEITYGANQGTIDIELYDDLAPITVANFLRYAGNGYYSTFTASPGLQAHSFIHRSTDINFEDISVIQGGGYSYSDWRTGSGVIANYVDYLRVPRAASIQSEYSPARTNIRGAIAMATTGDPNSATSEWYINQTDNSTVLQNGGYTVFGKVMDSDMGVVDAIASLSRLNESGFDRVNNNIVDYPILNESQHLPNSPFCSIACNLPLTALGTVPVADYDPSIGLDPSNLVTVTSIPNVKSTTTPRGYLATFTSDVETTFSYVQTLATSASLTLLQEFMPPPNKEAQFNDGIFRFEVTWENSPSSRVVTLRNDNPQASNYYYAYGPTPDNETHHWHDFSYDATTGTGAQFIGNLILLHFVDDQRGDRDSISGRVTHVGALVKLTDIATESTTSNGCSITTTPSPLTHTGDWGLVSLFLVFLAFARKRIRRQPL